MIHTSVIVMNTYLQIYSDNYKGDVVFYISKIFGLHIGLSSKSIIDSIEKNIAEQNLKEWTSGDNKLSPFVQTR